MVKTEKYLEGLTIHKVPYNIANTSDFKTNVMGKAADNELFIITDTPTFSLKIGNVTYDGTSNVSATTATQSVSGLMSAADKKKLDGIAAGANKTIVDTSVSSTSTNPVQNKVIKTELDKKAGIAVATTSANGLMSAADKTKLDGIATGATKITVDTALSSTSTNPVQNKVINSALGNKLDKSDKNTIIDMIYPVGSIYMSVNKTSPGTLFGGTWKQIAGKFLVGVGNGFVVGDSGGSKTHTHTTGDHVLTTDEMPYHYHNIWYPNSGGPTTSEIGYPTTGAKNTWCANACHTDGRGGDAAHNHGDTGSASNLPPYIAVWMWKRTA